MYRIGIIGTENSHAEAFTKIFHENTDYDCRVVAVGGHDEAASINLQKKYDIPFLAKHPEEMLGKVDAVMVTARDGKYHHSFVEPFLKAGIPAFIDKPFTVSVEDALDINKLSIQYGTPICGGSSLRYVYDVLLLQNFVKTNQITGGIVSAPVLMNSEYSGFYFYASHLAEMSLTIFGYNPLSVQAFRKKDHVTVIVKYEDYIITNHFLDSCMNSYQGVVFTKEGNQSRLIDISLCYRHECESFLTMLRTGKSDIRLENLIKPVIYLNAIEESLNTGKEIQISYPQF